MRKTATLLEQSLRRAKDTTTLHYEGEIKRGSSRRTVAGREAGGTCHQVIRIIRRGDFPAPEALKSTATPQPPHHRPAAIPPLPLSASLSSGGAARFAQRPARAPACPPRLSPHCACAGRPHEETAPPSAAGLRRAPRHVGPARQAHLPHRRQRRCRGWDAVGGPQRGPASPFSAPVSPGRVGFSGLRAPGGRLPPPSPPFPGVQRPRCVAVPLPAGSLCPLLCGVPRVLHFFFYLARVCPWRAFAGVDLGRAWRVAAAEVCGRAGVRTRSPCSCSRTCVAPRCAGFPQLLLGDAHLPASEHAGCWAALGCIYLEEAKFPFPSALPVTFPTRTSRIPASCISQYVAPL